MQRKGDRKIDLRGLVTVIGQLNEENTVLLSEIEAGKEVKSSKFSDKESKLFIIKRIAMKT